RRHADGVVALLDPPCRLDQPVEGPTGDQERATPPAEQEHDEDDDDEPGHRPEARQDEGRPGYDRSGEDEEEQGEQAAEASGDEPWRAAARPDGTLRHPPAGPRPAGRQPAML